MSTGMVIFAVILNVLAIAFIIIRGVVSYSLKKRGEKYNERVKSQRSDSSDVSDDSNIVR